MSAHRGSCHCGRITLELSDEPSSVGECNCSLCRRVGGLWHHCSPAKVAIAGAGTAYIQGDRTLATWRCPTCGCTTHSTPLDPGSDRMAVNLRMFDPALWQALPRRLIDGASF